MGRSQDNLQLEGINLTSGVLDAVPEDRKVASGKRGGMRKYLLVVPENLFEEIEQIAENRQTTVVDIMRRFLRLGVITAKIEENPDAGLYIKEGEMEKEIILL
jgi:hypothetical protein